MGHPDLLVYIVYIKRAPLNTQYNDPDDPRIDEARDEKRRLDRFIKSWFWDEYAGIPKGSQRDFSDTSGFEEMLEQHLEKLLLTKFAGTSTARSTSSHWLGESPFRGLQPFNVEHAPIFFGRTRARNDLREALSASEALALSQTGFRTRITSPW